LRGKKTQAEIAAETGFKTANMITMLKLGNTKLALDRVPSMAKALEVDPAYLLRLAFDQAFGETTARAVAEIWGTPITENERAWVAEIREASDHGDPRLTARSRAALRAIFGR
jgi:transcriptional regulator with XRE-family HTH domain